MIKQKQVHTELDPTFGELLKYYKVKRYFGKCYLVAIKFDKIRISEEQAKAFEEAQEEHKQNMYLKIRLENIKYGKFGE